MSRRSHGGVLWNTRIKASSIKSFSTSISEKCSSKILLSARSARVGSSRSNSRADSFFSIANSSRNHWFILAKRSTLTFSDTIRGLSLYNEGSFYGGSIMKLNQAAQGISKWGTFADEGVGG